MTTKHLHRVLSCIQPTSEMHIGNYFGAIEKWVALQESHDCIFGIADLHAITIPQEQSRLRENTERMIIDLLACGLDPCKSILFIQSLVPEHTELSWLLSCFCPFGELGRMTRFKEKLQRSDRHAMEEFVSAGLFNYPVLQAADILIYRAEYVSAGRDQEQHLEFSRSIARRINQRFGELFPEPKTLLTDAPKIMSLADPARKMSKGLGPRHYVGLFEDEHSIREKVSAAVTNAGVTPPGAEMSPGVANLFNILRACGKQSEESELVKAHLSGNREYRTLKEVVADALVEFTSTLREKRSDLLDNVVSAKVRVIEMSERAREIARETLRSFHSLIGLPVRY